MKEFLSKSIKSFLVLSLNKFMEESLGTSGGISMEKVLKKELFKRFIEDSLKEIAGGFYEEILRHFFFKNHWRNFSKQFWKDMEDFSKN